MRTAGIFLLVASVALIDARADHVSAIGVPSDARAAKREIAIEMSDAMRFTPEEVSVARGEPVRFVVTNKGQVLHEFVLGSMRELRDHAEHMKAHPDMRHDDANAVQVAPGGVAALGWRFDRTGDFNYGCLIPGHLEAGMVGTIHVTEAPR